MGFQQKHYNFACLLLWGLHFCNPIEHCALARSSTHMRPLILVSPIVKFSLCKESLVRIGEVFHNSSKSSQNILLQYKQKAVENQKFGGKNGLFLVFWAQIWPKNRSKYKIWILNTSESLWKWSNKSIFQLHILKLLDTTISKAIENQQFWKKQFGPFLVFWAQIWPKFGPKIGPNIKFELWIPQGVCRRGLIPITHF